MQTSAAAGVGCSYWPCTLPHCSTLGHAGRRYQAGRLTKAQAIAEPPTGVSVEFEAVPNATQFTEELVADEKKYIVQTYARPHMVLTRGEGTRLYDAHGKEYLDFAAGIAVNSLGHAHPQWVQAVAEQAATLGHTSNLFHSEPQVRLAKKLVELSFADKVFFCNSGTEANEAVIKFARKWARKQAGVDPYSKDATAPYEIVSFTSGFHGRTMGALAMTYKDQYKTPFSPGLPGCHITPYLDLEKAAQVIQKGKTALVVVEPLQGEGGVYAATADFLKGLRKLCDEAGALLSFDEVQCGLGRTGHLWGYELSGVEPDLMTLAKPLAGGLPIGAVLVKDHVAEVMAPGDHGSTFAGSPLVTHVAAVTLDILSQPEFLQGVQSRGERLRKGLREGLQGNPHVKEVRGQGLINAVQLDTAAGPVVEAARDAGLIVITAGKGDCVRLVPPLIITDDDVDTCVDILTRVINEKLG
ncbi:hypothetical protein WJX73_008840 [Symbiochloris irregularis]|uniref:acetylornithine transaminase n=1 Tax=Symbiochloris irregularis TaxID=706552 RepID=A0AAW1PWM4_9CHLO